MKTIYDIQQFLKNFGTIIYVRDRSYSRANEG